MSVASLSGLAWLVFSCGYRVFGAGLCVYSRLRGDTPVDSGNRCLVESPRVHWGIPPDEAFPHLLPHNVNELHKIQSDAQDGGAAHDVEEDLLLCGFVDVAVHCVRTGILAAAEQYGHIKAVVQKVEGEQRTHLKGRLKHKADSVGAEQTSVNAAFVLVQFSLVFGLSVLPVCHVQGHQQGRGGHHNELQSPETHLRDGEEVVKAGVLTAGLPGVAHEIPLLILPHLLSCCHIHQDPEEKDHREPDAPDHSGVLVHPTEDIFQKAPIHLPLSFL